ncbi:MAG: hypothetical protein RLZZ450_425 [Pseudomonadota bacterium]|jgi:hypothetical protein
MYAARERTGLATSVSILLLALVAVLGPGCERFKRKHIPVESLPELGYPQCAGIEPAPGRLLAEQHLRSGPAHTDKFIVERFSLRDQGCQQTFRSRQEWPLGTTDFEVVYDEHLLPLRLWKRMTVPMLPDAGAKAELRRYELRSDPVGIKRRAPGGAVSFEQLKGGRPVAVVGPGRGVLTMWLRRAKLRENQKVRELILDVRALEKIELVTLLREPDMVHPELGKVRVYTFFGRETVFADEHDTVIGDLMGMRPHATLSTPEPPAIPTFGPIDPEHTP